MYAGQIKRSLVDVLYEIPTRGAPLGNALSLYFQPYVAASQERLADTKTFFLLIPAYYCLLPRYILTVL